MIREVRLKNFKCFSKLELELKELNLFSGINSMGKSSTIQAFLLLRQAYENGALEKGLYLNGEYISIGTGRDLLYLNAENEEIEIMLGGDQGTFCGLYEYHASADYLMNKNKSTLTDLSLFGDGFEYVCADRLGPQLSYDKSYYEVHEKKRMGFRGEYAVHFLYDNQKEKLANNCALHPKDDYPNLLRQTEAWMSEITPGVRLSFDDYDKANKVSMRVRQMNKDERTADYFSLKNVGFGITCILPIVLSLLKAKEGDLLIIENPEAHLHPRVQRKMGELIAQGGVQLIVETHSDHLLNGIRLSVKNQYIEQDKVQVNFFQNNKITGKKEVLNPVILEDGRISSWPDGFFDEWDKAIDEMF